MKLTELCEEIIHQDENLTVVVNEQQFFIRPSAGGMLSKALRKGALAVGANPGLAALGAGLAVAAIAGYQKNKRNTMRLFAKDQRERTLYKQVVNDLMKSGGYKKVKEKHVGGGYLWELKRK